MARKKAIKKIETSSIKQHVRMVEARRGKPRQDVSHVLKITDWLYITCDKHTFILKEVNNEYDKDGNKYPDRCLLYAPYLDQILAITANYLTHIPADFYEMKNKLDEIKSLISSRIPADIQPKDLFEDCKRSEGEDEEG